MDDKISPLPLSTHRKNRGGAYVHRRGLFFSLARDAAGLPRMEVAVLACILLAGALGALAVIGILNPPPAM